MQAIYAYDYSGGDTQIAEKNMLTNIHKIQDLYACILLSILEVQQLALAKINLAKKKNLATSQDLNPNTRFVDNPIFQKISTHPALIKFKEKNRQFDWHQTDPQLQQIYNDFVSSIAYQKYMDDPLVSYKDHWQVVLYLFKKIIAPNDHVYEWYEDLEITWSSDYAVANTMALTTLEKMELEETPMKFLLAFKDDEMLAYSKNLWRRTLQKREENIPFIKSKIHNWDVNRMTKIDLIIIEMALTEFLMFPEIPTKVTLNEYIELAKEYSTPNSQAFVNGVLDHSLKDLQQGNKLKKTGRGLL